MVAALRRCGEQQSTLLTSTHTRTPVTASQCHDHSHSHSHSQPQTTHTSIAANSLTYSLTHSLTHLLTHPLTHSPTYSQLTANKPSVSHYFFPHEPSLPLSVAQCRRHTRHTAKGMSPGLLFVIHTTCWGKREWCQNRAPINQCELFFGSFEYSIPKGWPIKHSSTHLCWSNPSSRDVWTQSIRCEISYCTVARVIWVSYVRF